MAVPTSSNSTPTVGILYCGELGSAFGALLRKAGVRVITTCQGRSSATEARAISSEIEVLPSLTEVIAQSDFVFSFVLPSAAIDVAQEYIRCCGGSPKGTVFVDGNSIGLKAIEQIRRLMTAENISMVDATINGAASRLADHGVMHLSGVEAAKVEALCRGLIRVNLLGGEAGTASALKLLMSGIAKGLPALFLEISALAERAGMSQEFLQSCRQFYPELMKIIERTLVTYPRHASRRVLEIAEIEEMGRAMQLRLGMTHEACELTRLAANVDWTAFESDPEVDLFTVIRCIAKAFPIENHSAELSGVSHGHE